MAEFRFLHDHKVFAYRSLNSVLEQGYSWFEHFGDGIWARFAILLSDEFRNERSKSSPPALYSHLGSLIQGCFVVDVALTHSEYQLAQVAPIAVSELGF